MTDTSANSWRRIDPPRQLNDWECRVLDVILSAPFEGHETLKSQITHARVYEESITDPSVMVTVDPHATPARTSDGRLWCGVVPFELRGQTGGAVPIWVLVDTRAGRLFYLDVQRADGEPLHVPPDVAGLQLRRV